MDPTRTIGVFDAKTHLSELLERVAAGESFVLTRRGEPIARLVPVGPSAAKLSVDEPVEGARALRATLRVSASEIRSWVDEGRAP